MLRDLPRVMRGPLLLAKSTRVGATEPEVFGWGAVYEPENSTVRLDPIAGRDVWGAWRVCFMHPTVNATERPDGYLQVNACDFQSEASFFGAFASALRPVVY